MGSELERRDAFERSFVGIADRRFRWLVDRDAEESRARAREECAQDTVYVSAYPTETSFLDRLEKQVDEFLEPRDKA